MRQEEHKRNEEDADPGLRRTPGDFALLLSARRLLLRGDVQPGGAAGLRRKPRCGRSSPLSTRRVQHPVTARRRARLARPTRLRRYSGPPSEIFAQMPRAQPLPTQFRLTAASWSPACERSGNAPNDQRQGRAAQRPARRLFGLTGDDPVPKSVPIPGPACPPLRSRTLREDRRIACAIGVS